MPYGELNYSRGGNPLDGGVWDIFCSDGRIKYINVSTQVMTWKLKTTCTWHVQNIF
jgi:hypothetical protein